MQTITRLERISAQIEGLPEFWRPVAYGASLLIIWMGRRVPLILIPVVVIAIFAMSQAPLTDMRNLVVVVAFAIIGGALSGLAYSVVGRYALKLKVIGRYVAGIITLAPYMFTLVYIIGFTDGERFLRRPSTLDLITTSIMATVFGIAMGFGWFRNKDVQEGPSRPAT